jgi:hypothetical protein
MHFRDNRILLLGEAKITTKPFGYFAMMLNVATVAHRSLDEEAMFTFAQGAICDEMQKCCFVRLAIEIANAIEMTLCVIV